MTDDVLVPALQRWLDQGVETPRTVIIRLAFSQNPDSAALALEECGLDIQSKGRGLIVATSTADALRNITTYGWVKKVDVPREQSMKGL